jgi:hypothetical protein
VAPTTTSLPTTATSIVCGPAGANIAVGMFSEVALNRMSCDIDGTTQQLTAHLGGGRVEIDGEGRVRATATFSGSVARESPSGGYDGESMMMTVVVNPGPAGQAQSTWTIDSGFAAGMHGTVGLALNGPVNGAYPPGFELVAPLTLTA